jgi:hypothetical protein
VSLATIPEDARDDTELIGTADPGGHRRYPPGVARADFEEMAEALRGFLPRALREFHHTAGGYNLKVWYRSWHEHYEVQALSKARIEVGMHLEHPRPPDNDAVLEVLDESRWRRALGREAVAGPFLGRKEHAARWRKLSEVWDDARPSDDGTIIEAAERLSTYITTLEPLVARAPDGTCACWKEGARG